MHVVEVGAFHAQGQEDLVTFEEFAPPFLRKRNTKTLFPEAHRKHTKVILLDNLESEGLLALLTRIAQLAAYYISHHELKADRLPCII